MGKKPRLLILMGCLLAAAAVFGCATAAPPREASSMPTLPSSESAPIGGGVVALAAPDDGGTPPSPPSDSLSADDATTEPNAQPQVAPTETPEPEAVPTQTLEPTPTSEPRTPRLTAPPRTPVALHPEGTAGCKAIGLFKETGGHDYERWCGEQLMESVTDDCRGLATTEAQRQCAENIAGEYGSSFFRLGPAKCAALKPGNAATECVQEAMGDLNKVYVELV